MIENERIGALMRRLDSLKLDNNKVAIYLHLLVTTNNFGFSTESNKKLAEHFKVAERTITNWLAELTELRLIRSFNETRNHVRRIYVKGLEVIKYQEEPSFEEMTEKQKLFKTAFPDKIVDCDVPDNVKMEVLIDLIQKNDFLKNAENMTLKSYCIRHYDRIMSGAFKPVQTKTKEDQVLKDAKRLGLIKGEKK